MSLTFFGHSYCLDPARPMQTQPRIVESILEHFIDACEAEFWQEKQRDGFVSDAIDLWASRCIMEKTFVLQKVCKMWTAILRGNACINNRYLDIRRLFLFNIMSRQLKHQVIRQYDGAEMFIDARIDSEKKDCFLEISRDCTLESILPWPQDLKDDTFEITILHENNYFASQSESLPRTTQTLLDRCIPAHSIIILQSGSKMTVSLTFKANHTEALQHFLKKRKLNE